MTKNIIFSIFSLTALTILSCQNKKTEESKNIKRIEQSKIIANEQKRLQIPQTETKKNESIHINSKDSLDITFIGKTTQEINKYNFHACSGTMIEEKYAVSEYSLNINNCRNGKSKIFLEKFRNYYDQGKANFEIKDELIVIKKYPTKCYSTIVLKLGESKSERNYLIEYEDNYKPLLKKIYNLWEINLVTGKFIKTEFPKNFKCNNPSYADGI